MIEYQYSEQQRLLESSDLFVSEFATGVYQVVKNRNGLINNLMSAESVAGYFNGESKVTIEANGGRLYSNF